MAKFKELDSIEELEEIFSASREKPVALFKHSLTCPISLGVYQEMGHFDGDVNLIVVQSARALSDEVARRTGIRHESPQAIILRGGKPVYHASHYDISASDMAETMSAE